jgi:cell division protein FtsL
LSQRRQQILEEQRQQKIQDGAKQTGLSANDAKLADSKNSAARITSTEATVGARE